VDKFSLNQDKPVSVQNIISREYSWNHLESRTTLLSRDAILEMVTNLSFQIPGNIIEFGVFKGRSTRTIRRAVSKYRKRYPRSANKKIYACDSFEGLTEKFEYLEVGAFAIKPPRIPGVSIVKGFYEDTLTDELASEVGPVAFASLDADLYSSTICALNWLTPLLKSGSLLLFDEFTGENNSEKRAFDDWSQSSGVNAIKIGEFLRDPSGRSTVTDIRVLYQIVSGEESGRISARLSLIEWARLKARKYPRLYSCVLNFLGRFR